MQALSGAKILVTGPAGQIAFPLASGLARDNEVWGIARFGNAESRERVEKAGIQTRSVDLADPDWGDLPEDFDYVLHLAAFIAPGEDYETALRINAEGTGSLMSYCRGARACLVMSTNSVYANEADPAEPAPTMTKSASINATPLQPRANRRRAEPVPHFALARICRG